MNLQASYIDLPTPSKKLQKLNEFFDDPDNRDNFGFVRCGTCYQRFLPNMDYDSKILHLKSHKVKWERFLSNLEHSLNRKWNSDTMIFNDPRKTDDLVLSTGISSDGINIVIRLPKSRMGRVRYHTNRWKEGENSWNKQVSDEYQNNHIGSYQGNFDKPICGTDLRCGNWGVTFPDFVNYRHEPVNVCKIYDINISKYKKLENKEKIKSYFITDKNEILNIAGPVTVIEDHRILYTCAQNSCIFPCLCKGCILAEVECSKHNILHPYLFDPDEDFFTVRNGDTLNITGNTGNITFSNSMQKGYEMIYDVYKYAGIKRVCLICTEDVFHHQAFHFVYHAHCKFCRKSRHRIEGILTHQQFLTRFENRRYEELVSCHYCFKIFSSIQYKNMHVKNFHEEKKEDKFHCDKCKESFKSRTNLVYHTQKHHETQKKVLCEHCEKSFHLKQSLDVHIQSVHNFETVECKMCKQSFNRQSNLNSHYKYVHDLRQNILDMDTGHAIQFYECDNCQFKTRDERTLRRHELSMHKGDTCFKCMECDFVCNRMDNLNRHIMNFHQKESRIIHSCTQCDFKSIYLSSFERHMQRMHTTNL